MIDNNKMYNLNDFLSKYQSYCDWVTNLNTEKADESECFEISKNIKETLKQIEVYIVKIYSIISYLFNQIKQLIN